MQWHVDGLVILLISLQVHAGDYDLNPFNGKATISGEILASECSIALFDRYQTISLGDQSLRQLNSMARGYL